MALPVASFTSWAAPFSWAPSLLVGPLKLRSAPLAEHLLCRWLGLGRNASGLRYPAIRSALSWLGH